MEEVQKEKLRRKISTALRATRKQLGISQEKMAELLGISPRSYVDLERGKSLCSTPVFLRFLLYSGISAAEFLAELDRVLTSQ